MTATPPVFLDVDGSRIAVRHGTGAAPGIVWLGGYKSDMLGTKAQTLSDWAEQEGRAFLRHDYSGHGESGGAFADGTISKWLSQSLAVFRHFTTGKQVLVGSSMGAWIALRMVQELRKAGDASVVGLVLLAPAPDFTSELVEPGLTEARKRDLAEKGFFAEPSDYSAEPYIYTRALIEDGRDNRVMTGPIDTHCPVHILQGLADADVPASHALKLVSLLPADDVTLSLIPDGDHRLSRPQDLDMLVRAVSAMAQRGKLMRLSIPISAFVAAIVGFGGTLAIVIAAAKAVGATQIETASWVTAICLAMAIESLWLSWRTKMPVITAWSTPGVALIAASSGFSMGEAVSAFIVTAILLIVTGLFRPLTQLISRISPSVASGMLAGIVVTFAINAVKTIPVDPWLILPLIAAFFIIRLFNPALSVLAVLIGGGLAAFLTGRVGGLPTPELSTLTLIAPQFTAKAIIGLALPLYLVTMASQNLSGLAVLRAAGYHPEPGPLIGITGLFSLLSAPFGGSTTNLAAISAAICTGPDVHPDPTERWKTGPFYALAYLVFAIFGASLVAIFAVLPGSLIVLVAGLALMASLANALSIALKEEGERMAATVTFVVTASGLTLFGVGAAFWGLVGGLLVLFLDRFKKH